jgi:hypothetical protein
MKGPIKAGLLEVYGLIMVVYMMVMHVLFFLTQEMMDNVYGNPHSRGPATR